MAHSVKIDRYLVPATGAARAEIATLGAAIAIALAYFLAAQLGLSFLAEPSEVAVFWPASGFAAGILVAAGRRAGVALVVGVAAGTIAANLLSDRNLSTSILKGFCNAGEAALVAWLLERWFGRPFTFGDLCRVAGFLAAAGLATATSAIGGAATMTLFHTAAPFWDVWRAWFLSDWIGNVVVAPLVIALAQSWHEQTSRRELAEGAGVLGLVTLTSFYAITHPTGSWLSFAPGAVVLPLLLWLTARCQPTFPIAGAFVASIAVISATTFGMGRFGDAAVPIMERVKGAQVAVTMVTIYTLVLTALFAERRRRETELKQSNNRLQLALDCAELGTWSLHLKTGYFENDVQDRRIHGYGQEAQTLAKMRSQVHPDDLPKLDTAFVELGHSGGNCRTEYRLAPRTDQERAGRERWVTMEGTLVCRANGRPEQLLGVTRDITERKHAEDALHQREVELGEAQRLAHIGSWYWDADADVLLASDELLRIFGFDPATQRVLTFRDQRGRWYPVNDWKRLKAAVQRTMQTGVGYEMELQAYRNETPIWITARAAAVHNSKGQIVGLRGTVQDITERKHAELALAERNTQFELASKAARVGSFSVDLSTGGVRLTLGCAALYGLPEGTVEMSRDDARKLVHPKDLPQLELRCDQAIMAQQREFIAQFRITRADDGEVRWIETRNLIFYDQNGKPSQLIGISIDFTERKSAERMLAERNLQLGLAAKVGLVGSYAYDTSTETVQISPGYAAIHGLPEGTSEITRSEWLTHVHPDDVARLQLFRSEALRDRRGEYKVDYRIVRCDGEVRWIESRGFILYGSDTRAQRLIGVKIDVTERKRTEALIKESKTRLSDALTASQVIAFEWDAVTGLTQRSDNAPDILGFDQNGMAGTPRNFLAHMHPDDRISLKTRIRELRPQSPSYALTFRYVRPDGRLVWLEETARGEFGATGKLLRVKGLTRDITQHKQAEQALAERNAQLALAGRAALVGSYAYDVNKDVMQISEGYAAIHGLPAGTTETSYGEWRARVHPEDLGLAEGPRDQAFANLGKEDKGEYRIVLANGQVRWIERRGSISYDENGRPERVVGVNIDITERKRAEERQRMLVAELDHRVKNALATVSSVVSQTAVGSRSMADFVAALDGRIRSMATTQELLSSGRWQGISLTELIRHELAPYAANDNTTISGPEVILCPEAGQAMAIVLHELATNAAKYGALSAKQGHVSIRWHRRLNGCPRSDLVLEWQEIGGPPVIAPGNSSYGASTIRDLIPYEFGGTVDLVFATRGVRCRLKLPANWLSDAADPASRLIAGAQRTGHA